jgi:hypothetical protein|tara:strand:- start:956 stop:1075 length:120 start_codon:yes stop_codon:yes gene_type:complete
MIPKRKRRAVRVQNLPGDGDHSNTTDAPHSGQIFDLGLM